MRPIHCCVAVLLLGGTAIAQPSTQSMPTPPRPSVPAYQSAADAKTHCGSDPVVWANSASRVTHTDHSRYYGKTKQGFYACQTAAANAGYHAAKN